MREGENKKQEKEMMREKKRRGDGRTGTELVSSLRLSSRDERKGRKGEKEDQERKRGGEGVLDQQSEEKRALDFFTDSTEREREREGKG